MQIILCFLTELLWINIVPCLCSLGGGQEMRDAVTGQCPSCSPFTHLHLHPSVFSIKGQSWLQLGGHWPLISSHMLSCHSLPGPVRAEQTHGIWPTGPLMATSWSFKTCAAEWRAIVQTVIWWPELKGRQSQVETHLETHPFRVAEVTVIFLKHGDGWLKRGEWNGNIINESKHQPF